MCSRTPQLGQHPASVPTQPAAAAKCNMVQNLGICRRSDITACNLHAPSLNHCFKMQFHLPDIAVDPSLMMSESDMGMQQAHSAGGVQRPLESNAGASSCCLLPASKSCSLCNYTIAQLKPFNRPAVGPAPEKCT